jgi:hypothetical protein
MASMVAHHPLVWRWTWTLEDTSFCRFAAAVAAVGIAAVLAL